MSLILLCLEEITILSVPFSNIAYTLRSVSYIIHSVHEFCQMRFWLFMLPKYITLSLPTNIGIIKEQTNSTVIIILSLLFNHTLYITTLLKLEFFTKFHQ